MKRVYFVTTNKGKVNSVRSVLSKFHIKVIQESLKVPELRQDDSFKAVSYTHLTLPTTERV